MSGPRSRPPSSRPSTGGGSRCSGRSGACSVRTAAWGPACMLKSETMSLPARPLPCPPQQAPGDSGYRRLLPAHPRPQRQPLLRRRHLRHRLGGHQPVGGCWGGRQQHGTPGGSLMQGEGGACGRGMLTWRPPTCLCSCRPANIDFAEFNVYPDQVGGMLCLWQLLLQVGGALRVPSVLRPPLRRRPARTMRLPRRAVAQQPRRLRALDQRLDRAAQRRRQEPPGQARHHQGVWGRGEGCCCPLLLLVLPEGWHGQGWGACAWAGQPCLCMQAGLSPLLPHTPPRLCLLLLLPRRSPPTSACPSTPRCWTSHWPPSTPTAPPWAASRARSTGRAGPRWALGWAGGEAVLQRRCPELRSVLTCAPPAPAHLPTAHPPAAWHPCSPCTAGHHSRLVDAQPCGALRDPAHRPCVPQGHRVCGGHGAAVRPHLHLPCQQAAAGPRVPPRAQLPRGVRPRVACH